MTRLKPGTKLSSAVCGAQVIVIRSSGAEVDLRCGGAPMLTQGEGAPPGVVLEPGVAGGVLMGKRYTDSGEQIELLCVKNGEGSLTLNGQPLGPKLAKQLPSSD